MKKIYIIHGFEGSPNGGWRPWLMGELERMDIYACALPMPTPEAPVCEEWVEEIARVVSRDTTDEVYLVGHSLGVPAILRYLESDGAKKIGGAVMVSGRIERGGSAKLDGFFNKEFDIDTIKMKCDKFAVIHGDNDPFVPVSNAHTLSERLDGDLIIIENGEHLNGSSGWTKLPQALEALEKMFKS